ncbi:MAG: helix-turn-helix transcriptional regulator [Pseudomonadota bacterium]
MRAANGSPGNASPHSIFEIVAWETPTKFAKSDCKIDACRLYLRNMLIGNKYPSGIYPSSILMRDGNYTTRQNFDKFFPMNAISQIRKRKGLSQYDLAELAGTTQPTIARIERGSDSVTLRMLTSIAKALGVPVRDLFDDRSNLEQTLISAFRKIPETERDRWIGILEAAKSVAPEDASETNQAGDHQAV